ncbi:MAG: hypothetical protein RIR26_2680 [Pseudomonadota bacterium]|jgi:subtilisin family serine protease
MFFSSQFVPQAEGRRQCCSKRFLPAAFLFLLWPSTLSASPAAGFNSNVREFLVKVRERSQIVRFAQEKNLLVEPRVVLQTSEGDWYKLIEDSGAARFEDVFSESDFEKYGLLASEPNRLWRALGNQRKANIAVDPLPDQPPRLPRPSRADPKIDKLWGFQTVSAFPAWKLNSGNKDIVVGMIDTGIDYNHEDLINNIWRNKREIPDDGIDNDGNGFVDDVLGWDFSNNDNRPWDDQGHGSHTAGTVGAVGGNGAGISGLAQRVSLMPLKFLSHDGTGSTEDAIRAINYGVAAGAHILSNSWGGDEYSQALEEAITAAAEKDVLFVAAAGNDASDNDLLPMYPASYKIPNIISVAASDRTEQLADFSNFGSQSVDLAAPGDFIFSTVPGNKYSYMSGTSMACPLVAGAAALLKSFKPSLTAQQLKSVLFRSVDRFPAYEGRVASGGRLNVLKALQMSQVIE